MIIRQIPENFKLIYSKEDIAYSVYKMAGEMRHWVKDTHKNDGQQVLAICVLRGGVLFLYDVNKEKPQNGEPAICPPKSESSGNNTPT
ncbi:MAG: hypothetical protein VXU42_05480, partial [Verrucomicrobiota bacterium]|nr:hypothetical protein [Verrucomicrobiota bacterium]